MTELLRLDKINFLQDVGVLLTFYRRRVDWTVANFRRTQRPNISASVIVLDFRHAAPLQNAGDSKKIALKREGGAGHFRLHTSVINASSMLILRRRLSDRWSCLYKSLDLDNKWSLTDWRRSRLYHCKHTVPYFVQFKRSLKTFMFGQLGRGSLCLNVKGADEKSSYLLLAYLCKVAWRWWQWTLSAWHCRHE